MIQITPLERLIVSAELDGHQGTHRLPREKCLIGVDTDVEAVLLWLNQYEGTPAHPIYRWAAERLINWALISRSTPLSSLDAEDFEAFNAFLCDPCPEAHWVSGLVRSRDHAEWRPTRGPLKMQSRLNMLRILKGMCEWLGTMGYCNVGHRLSRLTKGGRIAPGPLACGVSLAPARQRISLEDWQLLRGALNRREADTGNVGERLAVELLYYGNLTICEVNALGIADLLGDESPPRLLIRKRQEHIYLFPPLHATLRRLPDLWITNTFLKPGGPQAAVTSMPSERMLAVKDVSKLVKRAIMSASEYARSLGLLEAAARFVRMNPLNIRHAIVFHAQQLHAETALWLVTGARQLAVPGILLYLPERACVSEAEVLRAFETLKPCWADTF